MGRRALLTIFAEFERALAAAQRYEDLRYGHARHEGFAAGDIPQRIFAEFYARQGDTEEVTTVPDRHRSLPQGLAPQGLGKR